MVFELGYFTTRTLHSREGGRKEKENEKKEWEKRGKRSRRTRGPREDDDLNIKK